MKTAALLDSESENDQREEEEKENVAILAEGMECMWFRQHKQLVRNRDEGVRFEVNVGIQNYFYVPPGCSSKRHVYWKALSIGLILDRPDPDDPFYVRWGYPDEDEEGYVKERSFSGFLDEVVCLQCCRMGILLQAHDQVGRRVVPARLGILQPSRASFASFEKGRVNPTKMF